MMCTHAALARYRTWLRVTLLLGVTACADNPLPTDVLATAPAFDRAAHAPNEELGHLVRLHNSAEGARSRAETLARQHGGRVTHVYGDPVQGFAIDGLTPAAAAALSRSPMVKYVEKQGYAEPNLNTQYLTEQSQWGLDRVDQRPDPLNGEYTYTYNGYGIHLYVVDSGIKGDHSEFSGRLSTGGCVYASGCNPYVDGFGHGTAVASIAAGYTAGVAKNAIIHSVRLDDAIPGGVPEAIMVDALQWVYYNRVKPAVMNMSYGDADGSSPGSFLVLDWLNALAADGVIVVLSAGNANRDAYQYRHNRVSPGLIVAAAGFNFSAPSLHRMYFSNYGSVVDIYGPGDALFAASITSAGFRHDFDGTSAAAPFVAGSALQMMEHHPWRTPTELEAFMKVHGTPNVINYNPSGTPNLFVARY